MVSKMGEEKVGLISPQEVKKCTEDRTTRPIPECLESVLPRCARAVALTTGMMPANASVIQHALTIPEP